MRITYISDNKLPSHQANSVQILQMASAMGRLGHQVQLLAPWHEDRVAGAASEQRLRDQFALTGPFRMRYLPFLALGDRLRGSYHAVAVLAARLSGSDLIYTRNVRIAALSARAGLRVVQESHMPPGNERPRRACRYLASSPNLARWVFISQRLRSLHESEMTLPTGRCTVEHDAVDLERFEPRLTTDEARRRLGLHQNGRPIVAHCGHLYPGRGGELLIDAAAHLPEADFLFIGGRPEDVERLRTEAAQRGVVNVRFLGHRPLAELPVYLFAADILAMLYTPDAVISDGKTTTAEYASPMKLFEYMAAGRAIVASRFPGIAEVLIDGINARLISPGSAPELREALRALLKNPALRESLGERIRGDVARRTWQDRATRILTGIQVN